MTSESQNTMQESLSLLALDVMFLFLCSADDEDEVKVMELFPYLFGCVYKFAKSKGWNSEIPLKEMFQGEDIATRFTMLSINEEHLGVPVQESQPSTTSSRVKEYH